MPGENIDRFEYEIVCTCGYQVPFTLTWDTNDPKNSEFSPMGYAQSQCHAHEKAEHKASVRFALGPRETGTPEQWQHRAEMFKGLVFSLNLTTDQSEALSDWARHFHPEAFRIATEKGQTANLAEWCIKQSLLE